MSKNAVVTVVLVAAALAALVLALGGPHAVLVSVGILKDDSSTGSMPAGLSGGDAARPDGEGGVDEGAKGPRGPVLFGSPREERKGTGGLLARVVKFERQTAVKGAVATLSGTGYGGEAVHVEATSDAMGLLSFASVPAGDGYLLRVDARGEAPRSVPDIAIRANVTRDLGSVFLGTPGTLVGRVVDERGQGVAGADVRVLSGYGSFADLLKDFVEILSTLDREPTPLGKAKSEADGRFRVEGLSPGPYVVTAKATGKRQTRVKATMTPEGAAGGEVTLVVEPGVSISGTVVDETGHGIENATLAFLPENPSDPLAFLTGRLFARTDESGAFSVAVEDAPGKWRAMVSAPGFPQTMSGSFEPGREERVVLKAGTQVEITVIDRDTGAPIAGAQVMAAVSDSGEMMSGGEGDDFGGFLTRSTDASGVVAMDARPGVLEMVMVSHATHSPVMVMPGRQGFLLSEAGTGFVGEPDREIKKGRTNRFRIAMASGVTLVGRVLDPQGNGISGAQVRSIGLGIGGSGSSAETGPDGAYRLPGLNASMGALSVTLKAPGYVTRDSVGPFSSVPVPKDATGEVQHDFTMDPSATVRGRVLDSAGNGVAGATVRLNGGLNGIEAMFLGGGQGTTGSDGTYVLFDVAGKAPKAGGDAPSPGGTGADGFPLTPGAMESPRVLAIAAGYVPERSEAFSVLPGASVTAPDVTLRRGSEVKGRVVDPGARPVARATVEVEVERPKDDFMDMLPLGEENRPRSGWTAEDGTFAVRTVPAGKATVTATLKGYAPTRVSIVIEVDKAPEGVEVRLRPTREAKGRVVGPDGRGVAGAVVRTEGGLEGRDGDEAWVSPAAATTDAEGSFVLTGLPPGRIAARVTGKGFQRATATVEAGGSSVEVRLSAVNPNAQARLLEVTQELMAVSKEMMSTKDDATKKALQKRLMDLVEEQRRLSAEVQGPGASMGN